MCDRERLSLLMATKKHREEGKVWGQNACILGRHTFSDLRPPARPESFLQHLTANIKAGQSVHEVRVLTIQSAPATHHGVGIMSPTHEPLGDISCQAIARKHGVYLNAQSLQVLPNLKSVHAYLFLLFFILLLHP